MSEMQVPTPAHEVARRAALDTQNLPAGWTVEENHRSDGVQYIVRFPNARGASVVSNSWSYGVELAVLDADGDLDYTTPITSDVIGHLDPQSLLETLYAIAALPPEQQRLTNL